jgi:hypothetical protein
MLRILLVGAAFQTAITGSSVLIDMTEIAFQLRLSSNVEPVRAHDYPL